MRKFFSELKRRKVLRVAAVYIVSSWVLLQVADLLASILELPDWTAKLVFVLLVVGFVPVLILAWAYDLTRDGIKVTGNTDEQAGIGVGSKVPGIVAGIIILAGLVGGGIWYTGMDARWARNVAMSEIEALIESGDPEAAFVLALEVEAAIPDDPAMAEIWESFAWTTSIPSIPSGATVFRREYSNPDAKWQELGMTPLYDIHVPFGASVLRIESPGYTPLLRVIGGGMRFAVELPVQERPTAGFANVNPEKFVLETEASLPAGMVRVPGWSALVDGEMLEFRDFFLGRFEVTNSEFQEFVDAGGYRRRDLWEHDFISESVILSFEDAMASFADSTGRPGPSTWVAGTYPDGEGDYPVAGVSWFEAAAYARFVGRELPTIHHWRRALAIGLLSWELPASNIDRERVAAVGEYSSIGWTGTHDMLGNLREWCYNAAADQQKVIVGGAWNDAAYMAEESVSTPFRRPGLDRAPTNGFRLAISNEETTVTSAAVRPLVDAEPMPIGEPVSDDVFAAILSNFKYDHSPLNAVIEETIEFRYWWRQRISIDTPDGEDRIPIYVYLPKRETSRHQTLVYWPGAASYFLDSIEQTGFQLDFALRNGRAVAVPVLKGMYERRSSSRPDWTTQNGRDLAIEEAREFRRAVDYLETRPDIESDNLAFAGFSWGGRVGAIMLAVDRRFKVAVLNQAGINAGDHPDINVVHYLPRVNVPVLHFSGLYDTDFRFETSSKPFFDRLGTAAADKKHVVEPTGHFVPAAVVKGETLDWLDKYLGPVE